MNMLFSLDHLRDLLQDIFITNSVMRLICHFFKKFQ